MKKVYSSHLPFVVQQLKDVLESHHIACVVRNEFLGGGAGELPPIECWPELWVLEDWQHDRAAELVAAFRALDPSSSPAWSCTGCGEEVEGQFGSCWRCGRDRPDWAFS